MTSIKILLFLTEEGRKQGREGGKGERKEGIIYIPRLCGSLTQRSKSVKDCRSVKCDTFWTSHSEICLILD